jgi:[ribosomal protein S18]-alanine N-acetyltransferase
VQVEPMSPGERSAVSAIAVQTGLLLDVDAELERKWARLWVARPPAVRDPIAFLLAWDVADEVHVIHVATHPDWRRQGAARKLMQVLVDHARARRTRLVLLEVRRSNRAALALYRAYGFSAIGIRRGYYSDTSEDAVEMLLRLDPDSGRPLPGRDELSLGDL